MEVCNRHHAEMRASRHAKAWWQYCFVCAERRNLKQVHLPVLLAKVPDAHEAQTAEDEAPAAANATLQTIECHLQAFVNDGRYQCASMPKGEGHALKSAANGQED
jgi:hypothetical protein